MFLGRFEGEVEFSQFYLDIDFVDFDFQLFHLFRIFECLKIVACFGSRCDSCPSCLDEIILKSQSIGRDGNVFTVALEFFDSLTISGLKLTPLIRSGGYFL